MNWNLVFGLSLFGLVMAFATVFVIPSKIELVFWLVIFLICAVLIARRLPSRQFVQLSSYRAGSAFFHRRQRHNAVLLSST